MKYTNIFLILALAFSAHQAVAAHISRVVKFNGIPPSMAPQLRKKYPFVFEREATLAEIDEIVRFLMKTGNFAGIEAIERDKESGEGRETVIVASVLRRIREVKILGAHAISSSDIKKILAIEKGQVFERKHLLSAAEDLRRLYENLGYHNAKVEIDFTLPNEAEVGIDVSVAEGSPVRISEVVIDSSNPTLNERLLRTSHSIEGRILTEDELNEFQKRVSDFLAENHYVTAHLGTPAVVFNPDRTQARLTYVIENPWVFEFKFEGNYFLSDYKIAQQLQEEKLSGAISSPAPDMADRIRRMYWAQGYANADVSVAEKLDASEHKQSLHFTIREGPRVRINKVEISGQISRPEAYYAKFLRVSSSDLIGQGFYNRKDIEDGVKRLMTELQNQGYFRAKVQSQRAEYSPDGSLVTIAIAIDEGPLTQVRQIRFEGVEAFPKAQLIEILKIKTGSALGLAELEESINALKVFYKSEGYLEMKIKNEAEQNRIVTYNEGNTQATVEFQIYEGPRVRVGTITSQGNTFTKDYVIMRELPIHSGDTLTPDKIDETIFRLQRLNLFSHVNVRMLEEGTNISERTIILEVTEKDPGTVITRLGATNERNFITLRALLGVSYNNIGGTGRGISFRAEPKYSLDPNVSYVEHILTLSYLEPFIFNDRNRGRVNLVREQLLSEFQANGQALIQEANTIGFLLERDLTRNIRLTYNTYSFSNERKFDRFSNVTTENLNIAKTGPLIEFDFRDDQWNPTKGTFSYLNLEYADPLFGSSKDDTQTINFVKINASTTNYQPILKRKDFVWVNQIRGGYLANISNDPKASIPSQEMFFLGGRSTIRGFNPGADENERIPNRYDLGNVATYSDFRLRNDSYFGLFKSELWFPIKGNIGGTLFYDGGAVIVNQPEVNQPMPYRDSVGFGIRYMTPVGPANIEIGFKLNRRVLKVATDGTSDIVEAPMALHISIGAL